MKNFDIKYDFDDILILPSVITDINSRSEINISYNGKLPLMTAPMDTVIGLDNMYDYIEQRITPVLPRTIKFNKISTHIPNFVFCSYGINEFKDAIVHDLFFTDSVLLDVANGHMTIIFDLAKKFKEKYPNKKLMVGNIANPDTYKLYAEAGDVDYIRIGIGQGNGCLTSKSASIGFPKASLIQECYKIKKSLEENNILCPLIVADGGMKNYSDIIKSLALGADYVMVGSIFNKTIESSGDNYLFGIKISSNLAKQLFKYKLPIKKRFYGMSTKIAQKKMGKKILKTSEGVVRTRNVEYTLSGWVSNFTSYLKSTMSYCNKKTLGDFIGKVEHIFITENAFNRFNK